MIGIKTKNVEIDVHHITRVEGHGNIAVRVSNGVLEQCDLEIVEAPRFFEAMLRGQPYAQAPHLASRICGICAVAHTTTSLRALEKALGVEPSHQTETFRKLNYYGELMDSHILHVYMLVAPDILGVGSVIPLARQSPHVVNRALRMKKLAGDICQGICGRHTHPIAMTVGGFTHLPSADSLYSLLERLEALRTDVEETVELFQTVEFPEFERETEYIALHKPAEYAFIDGIIASSEGGTWTIEQYPQITNEYIVDHSSAKFARHNRPSYMVGALARYNLNHSQLHSQARAVANALGLGGKCTNPFKNTLAQVVEIVHCYEEAIQMLRHILEKGVHAEPLTPPTFQSGEGVGACEAPRGTLIHHYTIKNGYLTSANCIIPTAQNLANIEADMRALVPRIMDRETAEITHALEMLVRAYDPCISCSTHALEVKFV